MLPGAFERTAGGTHPLKPDPVNTAAGQNRDSREMWTSPDVAKIRRDACGSFRLNLVCEIIQDTEEGR